MNKTPEKARYAARPGTFPNAPALLVLVLFAHLYLGLWLLPPSPRPEPSTPEQAAEHHARLADCIVRSDVRCFEEVARHGGTMESLVLGTELISALPASAEQARLRVAMLREARTRVEAQLAQGPYSDRARLRDWARYIEQMIERAETEWLKASAGETLSAGVEPRR